MVMLVMNYLKNSCRRDARRDAAGAHVLEYGRGWRAVGIGLAVVSTAMFAFLFVDAPPKPDEVVVAFSMVATLTVGLTALLVNIYRFSIALTDAGMLRRSPWRRDRFAAWGQVQRLTYNPSTKYFVVRTAGGTIRVPRYIDGLGTLRDEIARRVPSPCWSAVQAELDSAAR
jgi:hypothetical protein